MRKGNPRTSLSVSRMPAEASGSSTEVSFEKEMELQCSMMGFDWMESRVVIEVEACIRNCR